MKRYNSLLRCTYNRLRDNPKEDQISIKSYQKSLNNINLDSWFNQSSYYEAKSLIKKDGKIIFGGKQLFKKRSQLKISKEEFQLQRLLPIYSIGEANQGGNRKFKFIRDNQIKFSINRKEYCILNLQKLSNKYKKYIGLIYLLQREKQISITYKLDLNYIYITFDLDMLEQIPNNNKIRDRILSIDLNPNHIGYVICDWKSSEPIIIDNGIFSLKALNDKDNSLKNKGISSSSKERKYITNKRNYELSQIAIKLSQIAKHYQCELVVKEDLNIKHSNQGKGKKLNKLNNNQWCRNRLSQLLDKNCSLSGIKSLNIYPAWSSVAGNIVYRYIKLPDMCLAAIELGRRGFEFYHQYILKDKQEEKNIIFDNSKFAQEKVCQSLEELSTNLKFTTISDTLYKIKNSISTYRVQLTQCEAVFSKFHSKAYTTLYKFKCF